MNLARNWYFVQVGPLDPRAKTLPLPDDLMGRLIEYVAAHEVGHTLGFQHNMKASSMYTAAKVRDREWVKKMGHTPTLMDYSRFNYVAQPEDNIDVADLVPGIGPYDKWATMWGYKPIPGARTPDDEKKTLDEWARQQDDDAVSALLDDRVRRLRSRRADRSGRRRGCGRIDDARPQEPQARGRHALDRHDDEDRRAVRRPRRSLRAHARTVVHRDEPRRGDRRRLQLAAEEHRAAGRALHADPARQTGGGRPVPERQRVSDADLGDQPGDPAADRAGRRARPRAHRSAAGPQLAAEQPADRPAG